ncbi:hypothetical protein [Tenacibaculum mesophilum]|uniref:hypothetical protein n=1 Tax=Tenacibaculum mesophilum TaxID=104268 RepID=UPI0024903188|nr:hypothetical protein [Tenacibaculum mesophilum]
MNSDFLMVEEDSSIPSNFYFLKKESVDTESITLISYSEKHSGQIRVGFYYKRNSNVFIDD